MTLRKSNVLLATVLAAAGTAAAQPCRPDLDGSFDLNVNDFITFQSLFAAHDVRADFDHDGAFTVNDFIAFQASFAAGCDFKPDIDITGLSYDAAEVIGGTVVPVTVRFQNRGAGHVAPIIRVCIGGNCAQSAPQPIGPYGSAYVIVNVQTPLVATACGAMVNEQVTACSLLTDRDPSNNCLTQGSIPVTALYWDLRPQIVVVPLSSGGFDPNHVHRTCGPCPPIGWYIRVINVGNTPAPVGVRINTSITLDSPNPLLRHPCDLVTSGLGLYTVYTHTSIQPGDPDGELVWSGLYPIPCGASLGAQYIKAQIANDICGVGANNCASLRMINIESCP